MEQGEGDGDSSVESSGGDSDLADCCGAGSSWGTGIWHVGAAVQRQQAACLPASSRTDKQFYEGRDMRGLDV